MKPYNPQKFVPDMCKIAYNLTLKDNFNNDFGKTTVKKYEK